MTLDDLNHDECELAYSHTSKTGIRAFYCRGPWPWPGRAGGRKRATYARSIRSFQRQTHSPFAATGPHDATA